MIERHCTKKKLCTIDGAVYTNFKKFKKGEKLRRKKTVKDEYKEIVVSSNSLMRSVTKSIILSSSQSFSRPLERFLKALNPI